MTIGETKFLVSPLSHEARMRMSTLTRVRGGEVIGDGQAVILETLRSCVKSIVSDNIQDQDGNPFQLKLDEMGRLSDESMDALFQIANLGTLTLLGGEILSKMPNEWSVPGVTIEAGQSAEESKKK